MTACKLVAPSASESVKLDEVTAHARVDTDLDGAFITALITTSRPWARQNTGRAFIAPRWQLWIDAIPADGGAIQATPVMRSSVQIEYGGKVIQVDPVGKYDNVEIPFVGKFDESPTS